jgi:FrmR/RcnR family transcriptional regulator, repressor of frmRAB operon
MPRENQVHTTHSKEKLVLRVKRIEGQIKAIEKAIQNDTDCHHVLQHLAACRGAINGLMSEVIEGQILFHVLGPKPKPGQIEAAEQLVDIVDAYLK